MILGLIVGWFYSMFLCRVYGMFCGLNWEDNVASGQGLFRDGFGLKLACSGVAKELSGTLVRGSHAIAWLGSKFQLSGTQLRGTHAIAWLGSKLQPSGMQLRSPCTPSNLQLRTTITSSSKLRFGCSWTLWKAH